MENIENIIIIAGIILGLWATGVLLGACVISSGISQEEEENERE